VNICTGTGPGVVAARFKRAPSLARPEPLILRVSLMGPVTFLTWSCEPCSTVVVAALPVLPRAFALVMNHDAGAVVERDRPREALLSLLSVRVPVPSLVRFEPVVPLRCPEIADRRVVHGEGLPAAALPAHRDCPD